MEGTVAALAGRKDSDEEVRRMVQQAYRADSGPECHPYVGWWVAEALYQQLVGTWSEQDLARLSEWRRVSFVPEYIEGPHGFAHERRLSDKATEELKRVEPYP